MATGSRGNPELSDAGLRIRQPTHVELPLTGPSM